MEQQLKAFVAAAYSASLRLKDLKVGTAETPSTLRQRRDIIVRILNMFKGVAEQLPLA